MQPIPPIRAAARSRRAHRRAAVSVVGLVGLFSFASTASAEDILFANTVSYSIIGRAGGSGAEIERISEADFLQKFNTLSVEAFLDYELTRNVNAFDATGHVSATISALADFGSLGIAYSGKVRATTSGQLKSGYGIVDSSRVTARWQDTLIFTGNEPGRTTTIAATLKLDGGFGGDGALSLGPQVDAAYTRTSLSILATLNGTSVIPVSPYYGFGGIWGVSTLNARGGQPAPIIFEPPESVTVIMTFTQGQVYVLDYRMEVQSDSWAAINLAAAAAPQEAEAEWSANFGNTLTWGGITSVTDTLTGLPLDNYSLTSASGIDYVQAVPEPSSYLLAAAATAATMLLRRLRR